MQNNEKNHENCDNFSKMTKFSKKNLLKYYEIL